MFIRYDPEALDQRERDQELGSELPSKGKTDSKTAPAGATEEQDGRRDAGPQRGSGREFLFFGDVESEWRNEGEEGYDAAGAKRAGDMCGEIWAEAARSWDEGRLAGVFVSNSTPLWRVKAKI
jgi:hypothetical protein